MTETTPSLTQRPSDTLLILIVSLLAPMFLGVTAGDIDLARQAATQTVNDYRTRDHADLIAVAQIVGFGLAALGSLSLSLADDISLSMALRLRGNAVSCNRAAEQNRCALLKSQPDESQTPPPAEQDESPPQQDGFLNAAAAHLLAAESRIRLEHTDGAVPVAPPTQTETRTPVEKRHQQMWAIAMTKEASELTASLPGLSSEDRKAATMRAAVLSSTAHDLLYGAPVPRFEPTALRSLILPDAGVEPPPA
jgi:hypothetical protein